MSIAVYQKRVREWVQVFSPRRLEHLPHVPRDGEIMYLVDAPGPKWTPEWGQRWFMVLSAPVRVHKLRLDV